MRGFICHLQNQSSPSSVGFLNRENHERLSIICLETIKSSALPLKSINNIHGSDGLPPGVLGVGDRVPDHVLKEVPEDAPDLLIDVTADTLDTTSPGETADGWLCDTLDVLTHNLTMPLGTTLTETLTTFASSRHSLE